MKQIYIETYGCQMNVYDSARIADLLSPLGYVATQSADDADLVILNTCHIREKATEKVYSELGRLKQLKMRNVAAGKSLVIGVAGCVAQAEGRELVARQPAALLSRRGAIRQRGAASWAAADARPDGHRLADHGR